MHHIQLALLRASCSVVCLVTVGSVASAQTAAEKRTLNRDQREEVRHLTDMVEEVETTDLPGGDAWLKWDGHFLKGPDDKTYVPFTVTIDEAPTGFGSVGIYIKVQEPPTELDDNKIKSDDLTGTSPGELPINVPEQQFAGRGVPTAATAAANLVMLEATLGKEGPKPPPFEDVHFAEPSRIDDTDARIVQRAMAIEPGTYDLYVAVREFGDDDARDDGPRGAVLKRRLVVPNMSGNTLTTSSIMLTDGVRVLDAPYSAKDQVEHPYALGNVEVAPVGSVRFSQDEELALFFLMYNMASTDGVPDVSVRYRFYRAGLTDELTSAGQPMDLNADTLPAGFNLDAVGNQLPITYAVPLTTFTPGPYKLEVLVGDNIADTRVTRTVTFIVEGESD